MRATTTVSILRGERTTNDYLDLEDTLRRIEINVPASIQNGANFTNPQLRNSATQTAWARVPKGTDVVVGDRIKDERYMDMYEVVTVTRTRTSNQRLMLELTRI